LTSASTTALLGDKCLDVADITGGDYDNLAHCKVGKAKDDNPDADDADHWSCDTC